MRELKGGVDKRITEDDLDDSNKSFYVQACSLQEDGLDDLKKSFHALVVLPGPTFLKKPKLKLYQ